MKKYRAHLTNRDVAAATRVGSDKETLDSESSAAPEPVAGNRRKLDRETGRELPQASGGSPIMTSPSPRRIYSGADNAEIRADSSEKRARAVSLPASSVQRPHRSPRKPGMRSGSVSALQSASGNATAGAATDENSEEWMPQVLNKVRTKVEEAFNRHDQEVLLVGLESLKTVAVSSMERLEKVRAAKEYWQIEQHVYNKQVDFAAKWAKWAWLPTLYRTLMLYKTKDTVLAAMTQLEREEVLLFEFTGVLKSAMSRFTDAINSTTPDGELDPLRLVDYQLNLQNKLRIATKKMAELNGKRMGDIGHSAVKVTEVMGLNSTIVQSTTFLLQMSSRSTVLDLLHPIPSLSERHPFFLFFGSAAIVGTLFAVHAYEAPLRAAVAAARERAGEIVLEHLIQPVDNIVNKRKDQIVDAAADLASLEESREVLRQMLTDYVTDQEMTPEVRDHQLALARNCDSSVINDKLLHEVKKPLSSIIRGDILRLLLIDAERMKFDALVAINKMNEILHANFINIEMVALLPMVGLVWALYEITKKLFEYAFSMQDARTHFARLLREVEQTLIKLDADHSNAVERHSMDVYGSPVPPPHDDNAFDDGDNVGSNQAFRKNNANSTWNAGFHQLSGRIVYSVWQLEALLVKNPSMLSRGSGWKNVRRFFQFSFLGAAAGVAFGEVRVPGALRGLLLGGLTSLVLKAVEDHSSTDAEVARQFLLDLHELTPPRLGPGQKLAWFRGLWRTYELKRVITR